MSWCISMLHVWHIGVLMSKPPKNVVVKYFLKIDFRHYLDFWLKFGFSSTWGLNTISGIASVIHDVIGSLRNITRYISHDSVLWSNGGDFYDLPPRGGVKNSTKPIFNFKNTPKIFQFWYFANIGLTEYIPLNCI